MEILVLKLVADGFSNAEISEMKMLSITTIRTHVNNIYNKCGVTREGAKNNGTARVKAVLYYLKNKDKLQKHIANKIQKLEEYSRHRIYQKLSELRQIEQELNSTLSDFDAEIILKEIKRTKKD